MSVSTPLVLASASPRRRELLARAGVRFEVIPAGIDEDVRPGEAPAALAGRLAREKALAVASRVGPDPARFVLGADTIVVLGESVLGKPRDPRDAEAMLSRLVGRTHRVITAVVVARSHDLGWRARTVESRVRMRPAELEEIRAYVATGEPLDKAGAYAAQGRGRRFVAEIAGSESNVIGLPLDETLDLLREAGASPDPR
jgi:septum formation protein